MEADVLMKLGLMMIAITVGMIIIAFVTMVKDYWTRVMDVVRVICLFAGAWIGAVLIVPISLLGMLDMLLNYVCPRFYQTKIFYLTHTDYIVTVYWQSGYRIKLFKYTINPDYFL